MQHEDYIDNHIDQEPYSKRSNKTHFLDQIINKAYYPYQTISEIL